MGAVADSDGIDPGIAGHQQVVRRVADHQSLLRRDGKFVHQLLDHLRMRFRMALVGTAGAMEESAESAMRERVRVVFSAHSLPERIVAHGDPYPAQLLETARALAVDQGVGDWVFHWQSAGRTEERWLGPDILEGLRQAAADGCSAVVSCPIGFVADHLEVLYDLDIEAAAEARRLGLPFRRTASLNADPALGRALADAVEETWRARNLRLGGNR